MEFIHPYNEIIFREIGGGTLHWCGDGSNNFKNALSTRGLKGIHNSSMGDMDLVIRQIEEIQRINAETGSKLVYFSSMMLPNDVEKAQELVQRQKGMRGVLEFHLLHSGRLWAFLRAGRAARVPKAEVRPQGNPAGLPGSKEARCPRP